MASLGTNRKIGTLNEGNLHQSLKTHYAVGDALVEQNIGGFVVDVLDHDTIFEIQTAGFAQIRRKLESLVKDFNVVLVHPLALNRTLVKVSPSGTISRRKSPKCETFADLFKELVYLPKLVQHPRLSIEVAYVHVEELRVYQSRRTRRRRDWVRGGQSLVDVVRTCRYPNMTEIFNEFSDKLDATFTTVDLASALGRTVRVGRQAAYCLRHANVIQQHTKIGNQIVYRRSDCD